MVSIFSPTSGRTSGYGLPAAALLTALLATSMGSGCSFDPSGRARPPLDGAVSPDVTETADGDTDAMTPGCGDGVRTPPEACDGEDFGGQTCENRGFAGGSLSCTESCEIDDSQCALGGDCGNGQLDGTEECDLTEFGGRTCASETGLGQGELVCTPQCVVDTSGCYSCGNGTIEGPEPCDGLLNGQTCVSEGHAGGSLSCTPACTLDDSLCFDCNDGVCDTAAGETRAVCPADCGWVAVSAGALHTCAIAGTGTLWCWGDNSAGQLGDGTTSDRHQPTQVLGLAGVAAVATGAAHTCAALDDGTAWCWGLNDQGQLGDGGTTNSPSHVAVSGLSNVVALAAGGKHSCALSGQTLHCWGLNDKGQLGDDSTTRRTQPVAVSTATGLSGALSVTAGLKHTCAVATNNTAWCWGDRGQGRLGDGSGTDQHEPAAVSTASGLITVTTMDAGEKHTCAIGGTGAVWCWGDRANGRLGDGTNTERTIPEPVDTSTGLATGSDVTAGLAHSGAVDTGGAAWGWGENGDGQLGDGTTTDQVVPEPVDVTSGLSQALQITAGGEHTCALSADHRIWCWGGNGVGQLGDGTMTPHGTPASIMGD